MALQALAKFASMTVVSSADEGSGLELNAMYGGETHTFERITRRNALLLQTLQVRRCLSIMVVVVLTSQHVHLYDSSS